MDSRRSTRRAGSITLLAGLVIILAAEVLLFVDLAARGGAIVPRDTLPAPTGPWGSAARHVAVNMTPICWIGFLLVMDGLLAFGGGGSPIRTRTRRFALCVLASVPIWLWYDWINFTFLDAWRYHGLPERILHRYTGYFVAFGAICPGMFLAAELFGRLGMSRLRGRGVPIDPAGLGALALVGALFVAVPFVARDPIANLTIWMGPFLLLDPINLRLGAPSILADWRAGRYGRTVALMAGGLLCGLLWELWNYWAAAKWTYNLPFLGPLEDVRYFEMPLPGLLGFLPFGVSCWVMMQTVIDLAGRAGARVEAIKPEEVV